MPSPACGGKEPRVRSKIARRTALCLGVVAIALALGALVLAGYMRYPDDTKSSRAKMDCAHISDCVEAYYLETGAYPGSLEDLAAPRDDKPAFLTSRDLLDPWNKPYRYDPDRRGATGEQKPKIFTVSSGWEISN